MSIQVNCPQCGTVHHVNTRMAGKRVRCPHCDTHVEVPIPVEAPELVAEESTSAVVNRISQTESESSSNGSAVDHAPEMARARGSANVMPLVAADAPTTIVMSDVDEDAPPPRKKRDDGELDMTPMVDVTFLLLIFFMVTASFSLQKSIEMPRQQTDAPSMNTQPEETKELDMVTVQINEFGSFLVLAPDWERETPGKQNLIRALREAMGDGINPMRLVIEVHELAKLQALVDCMDAGTICDYGELQVTQVEGFE